MPTKTTEFIYSIADTFIKSKSQRRWEKNYPKVPFKLFNH